MAAFTSLRLFPNINLEICPGDVADLIEGFGLDLEVLPKEEIVGWGYNYTYLPYIAPVLELASNIPLRQLPNDPVVMTQYLAALAATRALVNYWTSGGKDLKLKLLYGIGHPLSVILRILRLASLQETAKPPTPFRMFMDLNERLTCSPDAKERSSDQLSGQHALSHQARVAVRDRLRDHAIVKICTDEEESRAIKPRRRADRLRTRRAS